MDRYLDGLSELAHGVLKRLKMGETGTIQCSKEYPELEVRQYIMAYALHKKKWFDPIRYDKSLDAIVATRAPIPDLKRIDEPDAEEEI